MAIDEIYTITIHNYSLVYESEDYKYNEAIKRLIQQDRIDKFHSRLPTGKPVSKSKNIVNRPRSKLNSTRLCRVRTVIK